MLVVVVPELMMAASEDPNFTFIRPVKFLPAINLVVVGSPTEIAVICGAER